MMATFVTTDPTLELSKIPRTTIIINQTIFLTRNRSFKHLQPSNIPGFHYPRGRPRYNTLAAEFSIMTTLRKIESEAEFKTIISSVPSFVLTVLYFNAQWAAPCAQMQTILTTLAQTYEPTKPIGIQFLSIDAEELPEISEDYDVTAVPYLVLVRDGKTVDTVSGCDATKVREAIEKAYKASSDSSTKDALPPALTAAKRADDGEKDTEKTNGVADLSGYTPSATDPATAPEMSSKAMKIVPSDKSQEDINARLKDLVKAASVMLFMKGTPSSPQCGFSRQLVALLRERGVRYGFFNILADEDVRQGLKVFADWPTFPQLWVDGELVGGLDIVSPFLDHLCSRC